MSTLAKSATKLIKAIIFDWQGTLALYNQPREETQEILEFCKNKGYRMAVVSAARDSNARRMILQNSPIAKYFELMLSAPVRPEQIKDMSYSGKDEIIGQVVKHFGFKPDEILIVDDRMYRGVKYGNAHGHQTIWMQGGLFPEEQPNAETGQPTYIIKSLKELKSIL